MRQRSRKPYPISGTRNCLALFRNSSRSTPRRNGSGQRSSRRWSRAVWWWRVVAHMRHARPKGKGAQSAGGGDVRQLRDGLATRDFTSANLRLYVEPTDQPGWASQAAFLIQCLEAMGSHTVRLWDAQFGVNKPPAMSGGTKGLPSTSIIAMVAAATTNSRATNGPTRAARQVK